MSIREETAEQAADHNKRLKKFKDMAKQSELEPKEIKEGEDQEMVMIDLQTIINHVNRLEKHIGKEMDLPEWVEAKITLAADYIGCVADYIEADLQVNEEEKKKKPKWLEDAEKRAEAKEGKLKESEMKSFKDFVSVLKEYESDKNGVYRHTKKASYGTSYSDAETEMGEEFTALSKTGDTFKTRTGVATKTNTGMKHTNTSYHDDGEADDGEADQKSSKGRKTGQSVGSYKRRQPKNYK